MQALSQDVAMTSVQELGRTGLPGKEAGCALTSTSVIRGGEHRRRGRRRAGKQDFAGQLLWTSGRQLVPLQHCLVAAAWI